MEDSRPPINEEETHLSKYDEKSGAKKKGDSKTSFQLKLAELFRGPGDTLGSEEKTKDRKPKTERFLKPFGRFFGSKIASTESVPDSELSPSQQTFGEQTSDVVSQSEDRLEVSDLDGPATTKVTSVKETKPGLPTYDKPNRTYRTEGETKITHDEQPEVFEQAIGHKSAAAEVEEPKSAQIDANTVQAETLEARPEPLTPEAADIIAKRLQYEDLDQPPKVEPTIPRPERLPVYGRGLIIESQLQNQTYSLKQEMRRQERELERTIKKSRPETEPRPPKLEKVVNRIERIEAQPTMRIPEAHVERTEKTEVKPGQKAQETRPETAQNTFPTPEVLLTPADSPEIEKVLEKVAIAAEHDQPIEKLFEQSHERKDSERLTAPVPIGNALNQAMERYAKQSAASPQLSNVENLRRTLDQQHKNLGGRTTDNLYASALRWGFWSAVTIIVFGLITYFVMR